MGKKFVEYTSQELLLHLSLYDEISINWDEMNNSSYDDEEICGGHNFVRTIYTTSYSDDFKRLIEFINESANIYGKCPECSLPMSLKVLSVDIDKEITNSIVDSYPEDYLDDDDFCNDTTREKRLMIGRIEALLKQHMYFTKVFRCTHCASHAYRAIFKLNWITKNDDRVLTLQKIGQYPSLTKFMDFNLQQYEKLLKKFDAFDDLRKGYYMAAHGLGIGSYAYLRRVLEKLIIYKFGECQKDIGMNKTDFSKLRMDEKLKTLKDYLPNFFIKNTSIYSIVSAGIHTLNEDDCNKYYPIIKSSIELILEQEITTKKQEKMKRETTSAISAANSEIKKQIEA
jgi:hypothetical protein